MQQRHCVFGCPSVRPLTPISTYVISLLSGRMSVKRATYIHQVSEPWRHTVESFRPSPSWRWHICTYMTLTFDLWPWQPFQQFPLTWWISVASFIKIPPLSTVTRSRCERTDNGRTDDSGRPVNMLPLIMGVRRHGQGGGICLFGNVEKCFCCKRCLKPQ